jgi:hypothetical protein
VRSYGERSSSEGDGGDKDTGREDEDETEHSAASPVLLRVFLSSPGDVAEERAIVRELAQRLPREPLLRGKVTVDLVAWDDPDAPPPLAANENPQWSVNVRSVA